MIFLTRPSHALILASCTVVSLASLPEISAQVLVSPAFKAEQAEDKSSDKKTGPVATQLSIHAAGPSDPLFRYRLWPAVEKRRNISVNDIVSRAIIHTIQASNSDSPHPSEKFIEWESLPLDEVPIESVKEAIRPFGFALAELQRGEVLMKNDYDIQLDELSPRELIGTLLPELQQMRLLSRVLCLRARIAAAEHRWDNMVDDCRLGFRLAEIAATSNDFLISRLVGQAIARRTMQVIEDTVTQTDVPNLYWALASVPAKKLFETRESIEFESVLVSRILKSASELPDTPIGENLARKKLLELIETLTGLSDFLDSEASTKQLMAGTFIVAIAENSREILASTDRWRDRVDKLSDSEAVLRATVLEANRMRDTWLAWSLLPDYSWDQYSKERNAVFDEPGDSVNPATMLILQLTPSLDSAHKSGLRSMQQYNFLLTLEALRMHAAEAGELPKSIDALRPVPAWRDSLTQTNFGYQRTKPNSATITRHPRFKGDTETTFEIKLNDKP